MDNVQDFPSTTVREADAPPSAAYLALPRVRSAPSAPRRMPRPTPAPGRFPQVGRSGLVPGRSGS